MKFIPDWSLWLGCSIILCAASIFYLVSIKQLLSFNQVIKAVVLINRNNNEIISIKGYRFSVEVERILKAISAENKAIYAEWEKEPICNRNNRAISNKDSKETGTSYVAITRTAYEQNSQAPSAALLLEEISIFVVLDILSSHLSTYFNDRHNDTGIKEFSREDFPEFLMKNRIINLLSTPIEQRPIFLTAFPDPEQRPEGEIFTLWGSDGAVYSRFDLTLPVGSRLQHIARNGLRIITKRLSISLSAQLGFNASVSRTFCGAYLHLDGDDVEARQINITYLERLIHGIYLAQKGGNYIIG